MPKNVFQVLFKIKGIEKTDLLEKFKGFMIFLKKRDSTTGDLKIQPFSYCRQISLKSLKTSKEYLQTLENLGLKSLETLENYSKMTLETLEFVEKEVLATMYRGNALWDVLVKCWVGA